MPPWPSQEGVCTDPGPRTGLARLRAGVQLATSNALSEVPRPDACSTGMAQSGTVDKSQFELPVDDEGNRKGGTDQYRQGSTGLIWAQISVVVGIRAG